MSATATVDEAHARALAAFVPGTGRQKIAAALLGSSRQMSRAELAAVGGVAGTAVAEVVRKLRWELGIDVRTTRTAERGEAMYLVVADEAVAA
jgi:biotin operon repressor